MRLKKVISFNAKKHLIELKNRLLRREKKNNKMLFNMSRCVKIIHTDGSDMFFCSAFFVKEYNFYFIFTEHHGDMYYHKEDASVYEYIRK
jgi:hypothetical protein